MHAFHIMLILKVGGVWDFFCIKILKVYLLIGKSAVVLLWIKKEQKGKKNSNVPCHKILICNAYCFITHSEILFLLHGMPEALGASPGWDWLFTSCYIQVLTKDICHKLSKLSAFQEYHPYQAV